MSISAPIRYLIRFTLIILVIGIIVGLLVSALSSLLHVVQHIAYQYSLDQLISSQSFLQGVLGVSPIRRVIVLIICGLISGLGFYLLFRFGKKLVTIEQAVSDSSNKMPFIGTLISACLQMTTVGLGSPLGREVAPREAGAVVAQHIAAKMNLNYVDTKLLIACAAGSGLAAVYNVPIAGILFTLEALLRSFSWRSLLVAILMSLIATATTWVFLGYEIQYSVANFDVTLSLIIYCCFIGPLLGLFAFYFNQLTQFAKKHSSKTGWIVPLSLINFTFIGVLSIYYPQILGNGKDAIQLGLNNELTFNLIVILLVLKFIVVMTSLSCGAKGGVLTPALMVGALITLIIGYLWQHYFIAIPMYELTVIGAAAFLASSMRMPITATVMILELTDLNVITIIPVAIAVAGSAAVSSKLYKQRDILNTKD